MRRSIAFFTICLGDIAYLEVSAYALVVLQALGYRAQPCEGATCCGQPAEVAGDDRCCGFGGTFAVRYPEVSIAMADAKLDDARGCDVLVSCDGGCIMQLRGRVEHRRLPLRVAHLATVLHEAGLR